MGRKVEQRHDAPLGTAWASEYMMFCLGHNLTVAGAIQLAYNLGRAHEDFEALRFESMPTAKRNRVHG